jgi:DNA mismatch repair protein MutS
LEHFTIDSQTFNDLDIFTAKNGADSIFDLFKNTRTAAARTKLLNIMHNPSNNLEEITQRRDVIRYFYDHQVRLEIKNEEVDLIEFYLQSNFKAFKNNPLDALSDYLLYKSSNDVYIIKTGIRYLIQLIKYLLDFIESHQSNQVPPYLTEIYEKINDSIETGVLKGALKLNEKRLKFLDVTKLDRALRGAELEKVKTLLQLVYELDIFEHVAFVASINGFSFPNFTQETPVQVNIKGLFHPSISNVVKNDVYLDDQQNMIFLTGSNMAGKSSLLKSLGLAIYLSHLGFPVPADAMETTVFNGLVTTINLPDNISEGLSHYYTEVKRVKDVAECLLKNDKLFVIFDELFRGTNVKDAFDGSSLIIAELSTIRHSVFIISTHIIELAAVLQKYENISFQYLNTFFENQKPVFTFLLTKGVSNETLGMYIVQNEGIVEILQQAAKASYLTRFPNIS